MAATGEILVAIDTKVALMEHLAPNGWRRCSLEALAQREQEQADLRRRRGRLVANEKVDRRALSDDAKMAQTGRRKSEAAALKTSSTTNTPAT
jgi:hypothetical protein